MKIRSSTRPKQTGSALSSSNNNNNDGTTTTATVRMEEDDPCWGDPTHCSLEHLLTLLVSRSQRILYESQDYILMNKPADLRMDGPYPATVHKLITYWYPPPFLVQQFQRQRQWSDGDHNNDDGDTAPPPAPPPVERQEDEEEQSLWLLKQLKHLHRHSDNVPNDDNKSSNSNNKHDQWRPCHQLDYATSGVLLLARTSRAASWASSCFERRCVEKRYLAILHGHVHVVPQQQSKTTKSTSTSRTLFSKSIPLPVVCPRRLQRFIQEQELQYRRNQQKRRPETFQGFQPPNAFLQIFQGRYARRKQQGMAKNNKKRKRNERLTEEQWEQVDRAMDLSDDERALLATLSWKKLQQEQKLFLKQQQRQGKQQQSQRGDNNDEDENDSQQRQQQKSFLRLKRGIERASECYNNFLREILRQERETACTATTTTKPPQSATTTTTTSPAAATATDDDRHSASAASPSPVVELHGLPTIFRVEGEDDDSFYIYMALAQVAGEFAMRIPADQATENIHTWLQRHPQQRSPQQPSSGGNDDDGNVATTLNFKLALTKCSVAQHATLRGRPVTKVSLEPRTGRRHQLRVHAALIGHPIVGDQTYECPTDIDDDDDGDDSEEKPTKSPPNLSPRMCLHALSLGMPLPPNSKNNNSSKATTEVLGDDGDDDEKEKGDAIPSTEERLFGTAPDPFPVSETGELTVSRM